MDTATNHEHDWISDPELGDPNKRQCTRCFVVRDVTTTEVSVDRLAKLELLADAVRAGLNGLPDHPWIPGAAARPVRDALLALDGALPTRDDGSIPIG